MNNETNKRVLLCIRFDGSGFYGWQSQRNGRSVQETLQNAVETLFRVRLGISGCGRTDSGVHAIRYFCHMDIPAHFPTERLRPAINLYLHSKKLPISVISATDTAPDFHCRYFIRSKEYMYVIQNDRYRDPFWNGRAMFYFKDIDVDSMRQAAAFLCGKHNFSSFMADMSDIKKEDAIRTMHSIKIKVDDSDCRLIKIHLSASGFLYKMARIIVGTLLEVSEGKRTPQSVADIITAQNRAAAGRTAVPEGLYLYNVEYYDRVIL